MKVGVENVSVVWLDHSNLYSVGQKTLFRVCNISGIYLDNFDIVIFVTGL